MKLAAVHSFSKPGAFQENLNECFRILSELETKGVEYALFPELCVSGYTKCPEVLSAFAEAEEYVQKQILDFSNECNIAFSLGLPEICENKIFISQQVFHKGKLISLHRKTHLGPTEKEIYAAGNKIETYNIGDLPMGQQICYESHFPELSAIQAAKGANLLNFSFASPFENSEEKLERLKRYLMARAYDNSCYVLACNSSGLNDKGDQLAGLSLLIDPKGKLMAKSIDSEQPYLIANLDLNEINRIRNSRMACFNQHKNIELIKNAYESILPHSSSKI